MQARAQAIAGKLPFAFETVMSHPSRISEMLMLEEQGYHLFLTFITTNAPERNVARVKFRYETGSTTGHYVQPEKVRERYHRTLALLPRAAEIADAVYVYDNSIDGKGAALQVVIERDGLFSIAEDAQEWVIELLAHPLQEREKELDDLLSVLEKFGHAYGDTDELRGTCSGKVLSAAAHFIAQYDDASKLVVIHDRSLLETANGASETASTSYEEGEYLTVRYTPDNAPRVERQPAH